METPLKKCVLITGCSSGIGRAAAIYFHKQGWRVVATMRFPAKETELNLLDDVLVETLDVTSKVSIDTAIVKAIRQFGRIDVLVNNAGVGHYAVFEEVDEQQIRDSFETNIFGTMCVIRAILPHFRANNSGRIINVTSTIPQIGAPLTTLYCTTKMAMEGFSRALYYELLPLGIRVILVQPGTTKTNIAMQHEFSETVQNEAYSAMQNIAVASFRHRFETSEEGSSPEEPARVIYAAAVSNSKRFRFVSGQDAKLANFMKRLLPEHALMGLAARMTGLDKLT